MALSDYIYSDGTISVTTNQKTFTGTDTAWLLRGAVGAIVIVGGVLNIVGSISAENAGQFMDNWAGATQANAPYRMWLVTAEAATNLANHFRLAQIIASIEGAQGASPVLSALAELTPSADKLAFFSDEDVADLVDFKAWARSLLGLTMAADKLPYGTGANTMDLVDFKAWARSMLGLTPAANKGIFFTSGTAAALFDLTAAGRAIAGGADAAAQLTTLGFSPFVQSLIDDLNGTTLRGSIGLGNVDNTSDASKPVSTAQAAANALKLSLAGGQMSGTIALGPTAAVNGIQLDAIGAITLGQGAGILWQNFSGLLIVSSHNNGMIGLFAVGGGVAVLIGGTGGFTTTPNNAGAVNCFYEPTFQRYQVQNMLGGPITISVCAIRTRTSV